jgi:8-oxo-dGTP diphosphatase
MFMVDVVAALIRRDDQVLICQRPAHKKRGLKWEFPGGKVEPGETPQAALRRECREELGVDILVGEKRFELIHRYPDLTVRLMVFDTRLLSGEPACREHAQILWERVDRLSAYPFCEADGPILEALARQS